MSSHELEFRPDPLDADAIASSIHADLEAFNRYVEQELSGIRLFGAVVSKLAADRPDETHVDMDIAGGKVALGVAEITGGGLPKRLTDPNTPVVQDVFYPPVNLPDGNYALLHEVIHRRSGIDSEVASRIPWLHIMSEEALTDFKNGEVDYVTDVALVSYVRHNFDRTGRAEDEAPFSTAHGLFFLHPLGQEASSKLELDRLALLQEQSAYLARLQTIAGVLDIPQEG